MGAGLSPLQKNILVIAYRNHIQGRHGSDIYNRDVLIQVYGFKPSRPQARIGGIAFSRQAIGLKRYSCGMSVVNRSIIRLKQRGFFRRGWGGGYYLTGPGKEKAESLTAEFWTP